MLMTLRNVNWPNARSGQSERLLKGTELGYQMTIQGTLSSLALKNFNDSFQIAVVNIWPLQYVLTA